MSLDLDVLLLVGVDYYDVVEECEEVVETVVKYNENTGVPYNVNKKKTVWKIGEKVFPEEWMAYDAIGEFGLSVYEQNGDPVLIGLCLDTHRGERVASGLGGYVEVPNVEEAISDIEDALDQLGVKNVSASIRTFSQASF